MPSINELFNIQPRTAPEADDRWVLPREFIGLEIETENYEGTELIDPAYWVTHHDGSLRNGVEWVTNGPMMGSALTAALREFFSKNHSYETGPRTSIHIHINASDNISVEQLRCWLALVYIIEPAIFRWADENRKWCGYCAPLTDMSVSRFATVLAGTNRDAIINSISPAANNERYYGCNIASLSRHGTMEFRYFPCVHEEAPVVEWIQFIMEIKKEAIKWNSVPALMDAMGETNEELERWIKEKFPLSHANLLPGLVLEDAVHRALTLKSMCSEEYVGPATVYPRRAYTGAAFSRLMTAMFPDIEAPRGTPSADDISEGLYRVLCTYSANGYTYSQLAELAERTANDTSYAASIGRAVDIYVLSDTIRENMIHSDIEDAMDLYYQITDNRERPEEQVDELSADAQLNVTAQPEWVAAPYPSAVEAHRRYSNSLHTIATSSAAAQPVWYSMNPPDDDFDL